MSIRNWGPNWLLTCQCGAFCRFILAASMITSPLILSPEAVLSMPTSGESIAISYGQTVQGSITSYGQIEEFTFVGSAGDIVLIREVRTSGGLNPFLEVYGPGGELVFSAGSLYPSYNRADLVDSVLPEGGSYTVVARDDNGNETGDYWLTLQCRQEVTARAVEISYDTLVTDSVVVHGEIDGYRFAGSAGDRVIIRQVRTSGGLNPFLEVYGPGGGLVFTAWPLYPSYNRADLVDAVLPESGSYVVMARDIDGDGTGGYWLSLQCREEVMARAVEISYNTSMTDSVVVHGGIDGYRFVGSAGDIVIIREVRTSGGLNPFLEVYGPGGELVFTAGSLYPSYNRADLVNVVLPEAGSFVVMARDLNGNGTGDYWLSLVLVQVDVDSESDSPAPTIFTLLQNYPNPFNTGTVIHYSLRNEGSAKLDVYDVLGRHVRTLFDGLQSTGLHDVVWDGRAANGQTVASGVYFYRLTVGEGVESKKMVLLK